MCHDGVALMSNVLLNHPSAAGEDYLTRGEAADYLKLSTSYLAKLAVTGGGPIMCRLGRSVRYRRRDLDAWAAAGACRSTSEAA